MQAKDYMQRALQLAKLGLGTVSPNPMVGCVIVYNNKVIGEGWHRQFGKAHAEVNAIESVKDKSLLPQSTVFVTLEPCSYHGKTPACTNLLIKSKIKKVVIASLDPNPKVAGSGAKALKDAGIEVETGLLEAESIALNKRFFINQLSQRPYIILKWAQTADGFMARKNYDSKWISNELSRQWVHRWRTQEDAILIGKNTATYDNPSLTARQWYGLNPTRVVLDSNLELPNHLNLFDGTAKTFIFNTLKSTEAGKPNTYIKLAGPIFIDKVLKNLFSQNIGSVLVEGGSKTLQEFIRLALWDECRVFTATSKFKDGIKAPLLKWPPFKTQFVDTDQLQYFYNPKSKEIWQKN